MKITTYNPNVFDKDSIEEAKKIRIGNPLEMSTQIGAVTSKEHFDKIIDRNLKLRERGEKKYEKGSYYLKTRSRVGKGSNKYNSTHVEQALANEGKNLNEDEKNYIRKFYKDRNYDVPRCCSLVSSFDCRLVVCY